jgi:HPt (histidine-containing phosphotransfer) domain-containing protein
VSAAHEGPGRRVIVRSPAATALLPRFLEHRRRDVVTLRAALEQGDFETIGRIGHNMAGNGASYGFPEMSTIGRHLEAEASAGNVVAVRVQLASLEACLERVENETTA